MTSATDHFLSLGGVMNSGARTTADESGLLYAFSMSFFIFWLPLELRFLFLFVTFIFISVFSCVESFIVP